MSRSRRLRKKLFLHDFAVYGFSLTCKLTEPENEVIDKFIDEFVTFLGIRGLAVGGGYSNQNFEAFVCSAARYGSPTEADVKAVTLFLDNRPIVADLKISGLVDANYGTYKIVQADFELEH